MTKNKKSKKPKDENWVSEEQYGNWLPFDNKTEEMEAMNWLNKFAIWFAFRHPLREKDENDPRDFSYYPVDIKFIIHDPIPPFKTSELAIKFRLAKLYAKEGKK